jgi:hypothetical protein
MFTQQCQDERAGREDLVFGDDDGHQDADRVVQQHRCEQVWRVPVEDRRHDQMKEGAPEQVCTGEEHETAKVVLSR